MPAAGCSLAATAATAGLCPVASSVAGGVAGSVSGGVVQSIANAFASSANKAIEYLVAGWTRIPTPAVSGATAEWLQGQLRPIVIVVGALALIAAAVRMVWANRSDPAKQALAGLLRLVVVSGAGLAGIDLLLKAGDALSNALLNAATPAGGNFGHLAVLSAGAIPEAGLLLILSLVAILASLIQIFLLIARAGLVVVLGGTWPMAAAASGTDAGNAWFKKSTAWLLAFVAFKPAASVLYAAALRMTLDSSSSGLVSVEGVMLFALAIIALPALLRFAVPVVAPVGGISAGKVAAGAVVLATGAIATRGALGAALARPGAAGASGAGPNGGPSGGPTGAGPSGSAPPAYPSGAGPAAGGGGTQPPPASGAPPAPAAGSPGGAAPSPADPTAAARAGMRRLGALTAVGSAAHAVARAGTKATGEDAN